MKNYSQDFSLENKVAFVCGGAGLIGREIAMALANFGAKVIVLDVNRTKAMSIVKEIRHAGGSAHFEFFDSTKLTTFEKKLAQWYKKYSGMDVWVNVTYPRTSDWGLAVEKLKLDSFKKNVDMHLVSYVWMSRCVGLAMKKNKIKGSIINFGSIYGVQASDFTVYEGTDLTMPMAYAAIKAGIVNSSRYLASYFGKDGIRFNTICPGGVKDNQPSAFVKKYEHKVPLKRMAVKEEIPMSVVFLASKASSYITGETLMVDGGWTVV